jgi:hypothetical protein
MLRRALIYSCGMISGVLLANEAVSICNSVTTRLHINLSKRLVILSLSGIAGSGAYLYITNEICERKDLIYTGIGIITPIFAFCFSLHEVRKISE